MQTHFNQLPWTSFDSNSNKVLKREREKKGTVNDIYETEFLDTY